MKTVIVSALCECVHVAGISNFLRLAEAAAHNFDLLVSSAPPDTEVERQAYQGWAHGQKADGLVINHLHLHDWRVQYLSQAGFHFVTTERSLDPLDYASVEKEVHIEPKFEIRESTVGKYPHNKI